CDNWESAASREPASQLHSGADNLMTLKLRTGIAVSALALVALVLSPAVRADESVAASADARASLISHLGISNFGEINPNYYRGSELAGHDAKDLAALGVKTVIDLRNDHDYDVNEARLVSSANMTYVRIPMTTHVPPTEQQLAQFLSLVTDPAKQPVYV